MLSHPVDVETKVQNGRVTFPRYDWAGFELGLIFFLACPLIIKCLYNPSYIRNVDKVNQG